MAIELVEVKLANGDTVERSAFAISKADLPARRVFIDGEWRDLPERTRTQYAVVLGYNETAYDMSGNAVSGIAYIQKEVVKEVPPVLPEFIDDETLKAEASAVKKSK